jgi:two-component system response regulator YesN
MKPVDQEELRANIEKVISEIEKDNQLRQFTEKMKTADDIDTLFIKSDKENDYVQQVLTATIRIHRRLIL